MYNSDVDISKAPARRRSDRLVFGLPQAPRDAKDLASIWDENAHARRLELSSRTDASYRALSNHVQGIIRARLRPPAKILDVGSGLGFLTDELALAGYEVIGIDPSAESINLAANDFHNATYVNASIEEYSLRAEVEESFDLVLANMVLHSVAGLAPFVSSVARVLKVGGTFLATLPHPAFYLSGKLGVPLDSSTYTMDEGVLIRFQIYGGVEHPARIPFFQRTISQYTDALWQSGLRDTRLLEKRSIGPGKEFDILTIIATKP